MRRNCRQPGRALEPPVRGVQASTPGSGPELCSPKLVHVSPIAWAIVSSSGDTGGVKLDLPVMEEMPIPVHDIPGLESITFYETTGKVTEYTFLVAGPELSNLLADPLTLDNRDIQGTSVEFYDVYYSDEDGTFNADGSYLTIAGSFGAKLPAGGGLNLAEISLNSAIIA